MEMKLYCWDRGVYGMTVVVAKSLEAAYELFDVGSHRAFYEADKQEVTVHEIKEGLSLNNDGDT